MEKLTGVEGDGRVGCACARLSAIHFKCVRFIRGQLYFETAVPEREQARDRLGLCKGASLTLRGLRNFLRKDQVS